MKNDIFYLVSNSSETQERQTNYKNYTQENWHTTVQKITKKEHL